jgi:outer membrane protein, heavy metal efflux system
LKSDIFLLVCFICDSRLLGEIYMIINVLNHLFQFRFFNYKCICSVVGLSLIFSVMPAWAGTSSKMLSEQDAIRIGLDRPEIQHQIQSRTTLAESEIVEAETWANPEFSFDQENMNEGPDDIYERNYMLSQEFSISGQRTIRVEAARQRLDAEAGNIAQWRLEKTVEIKQKFYELLYRQEVMGVYKQMRSAMDSLEMVMQERKNAGDISGYDLGRLKQEKSFLVAEQSQAQAEQKRFIQEFLSLIGLSGNTAFQWPGVSGTLFPQEDFRSLESLLEQAADQPGLKAMKLQAKAYETDERHAKRSWIPDLTLGIGYKDTDEQDGDAILFGASIPIPIFDRNAASLKRAQASRQQLQSEYSLALAEKKGAIRGLWYQGNELADAVNLLDCAECDALLETAKIAYQAGEIGVLEILDAYRSAFDHEMQHLTLMREARMVKIELELNTGGNIQ